LCTCRGRIDHLPNSELEVASVKLKAEQTAIVRSIG
jgi:hypothetical protein